MRICFWHRKEFDPINTKWNSQALCCKVLVVSCYLNPGPTRFFLERVVMLAHIAEVGKLFFFSEWMPASSEVLKIIERSVWRAATFPFSLAPSHYNYFKVVFSANQWQWICAPENTTKPLFKLKLVCLRYKLESKASHNIQSVESTFVSGLKYVLPRSNEFNII